MYQDALTEPDPSPSSTLTNLQSECQKLVNYVVSINLCNHRTLYKNRHSISPKRKLSDLAYKVSLYAQVYM